MTVQPFEGPPSGTPFSPKPLSYSGKIRCDICLQDGYPGGRWMNKHASHVVCGCGKIVPATTIGYHQRHCSG